MVPRMNERAGSGGERAGRPAGPEPGLCRACRFRREVITGKGSRFILCERSRTDSRFPRYPELPVLTCRGFRRENGP